MPLRPPVTILTSGIGLGVYIPALLIQRQLARVGVVAEVEVLEAYYTADSLRHYITHREACRKNFAFAQLAHRMTRGVQAALDEDRIGALLDAWTAQRRVNFIVWSGFWLPLLEDYRRRVPDLRLQRDLCRIDADVSASFKVHREFEGDGTEIWLWRGSEASIVHQIPVAPQPPVPFADREDRLVVHGGGWGLGTYTATLPTLARAGYRLDVVVHDLPDRPGLGRDDRCYIVDPAWEPWQRDGAGRHVFPPVGVLADDGCVVYEQHEEFHAFHRVIRGAKAVVSKPGGCTLIDSLASATPVILLEPYGYAEQCNAAVWEHLGFGVSYSSWEALGFDPAVLERSHAALMQCERSPDGYPGSYAARLAATGAVQ